MARRAESTSSKPAASFEEALAELEEITRRMESGDVPLEESLSLYERGTMLVKQCQERLNDAEKRIEEVTKKADGSLGTKPLSS